MNPGTDKDDLFVCELERPQVVWVGLAWRHSQESGWEKVGKFVFSLFGQAVHPCDGQVWLLNQSFSLFGHGGPNYRTVVATLFSVPLSDSITIGLGPSKTFFEAFSLFKGPRLASCVASGTKEKDTGKSILSEGACCP